MNNLNGANKENANENIFKTPITRHSVRRAQSFVKQDSNAVIGTKSIPRKPSLKVSNEKTISKDLDDLSEKLKSKASLSNITDDYFNNYMNGKKTLKSSNKSMSSLGSHRLTAEQATKLLDKLDAPFCATEIAQRIQTIKSDIFPRINVHMRAGYNLLLFGFGSKKELLDNFQQTYLKSENCVVVPGYCVDVNIQTVLTRIVETYMADVKTTSRSVQAMSETIRDYFNEEKSEKLYLVVHNIDGLSLRNSANVFTILMRSKGIQIIATVDHIHSGMMWTENKSDWVWHDCTTLEPYKVETRVDNARLMCDKTHRGMASLLAVVDSLNDQAKAVFMHLAKYQLQHRGQLGEGMLLDNLYTVCKDSLLVSSELALRTHLTEFRDHKLVVIKQGMDRADYIRISLDSASIKDFLDNHAGQA